MSHLDVSSTAVTSRGWVVPLCAYVWKVLKSVSLIVQGVSCGELLLQLVADLESQLLQTNRHQMSPKAGQKL